MAREAIDISNQKFGRLTVIKRSGTRYGQAIWKCICECGKQSNISGHSLRKGITKSCGCLKGRFGKRELPDLSGTQFGRWTVIKRTENKGTQATWECICECGSIKYVTGHALRSGNSQSCGCLARDIKRKYVGPKHPNYKHGRLTKTAREQRQKQMKSKCEACGSIKKLC